MDDLLFENYTPEADAPDALNPGRAAASAQTRRSESIRRTKEQDFDQMLDALLLDLGEYQSFADTDMAPTISLDEAPIEDLSPTSDTPPTTESASQPAIARADEQPEDEPELESAYLRRVARREAQRSDAQAYPASEPEDMPPSDGEEYDEFYELDSEIAEELDDYRERLENRPAFLEKLAGPLIRFLATQKTRQKLREQEAASWPAPVDIRQTPELSPAKAARYYGAQIRPLETRLYISLFLTLVLAWIGLRLPLAGQLCRNIPMQSAVSLVFLLTAMLCALDVVTAGVRQLFHFQPAMEALCVVSCLAACLDALLVTLGIGSALPFCALPAASLSAALWGEKLNCMAQSINLSTAAQSRDSSILSAEQDSDGLPSLLRSDRAHDGIVRRSEEPDGSRHAYAVAAPLLLLVSLVLGVLSTIGQVWTCVFHNLSAYLSVCANISGFLCFALPYLMAVLPLRRSGAAIAGWSGCADIGRTRRIILKDTDLFPPGMIRLSLAHIPDGVNVEKVVSYAVSILTVSGSSVTGAFSELMQYRKYALLTVNDFKCHDGGGFSAYIHGENVLVGSQGFLNLMGIRLPQDLQIEAESAVCVAISNELVGVFRLEYIPVKGVHKALDLLQRGRTQPVFAIRDFNITPLMIQNLFHIPAIRFEFPSFRERYRLSSLFGSDDTPPAAILLRPSVRCAVETAERGRKLYTACVLSTVLSIFSTVLGLLFLFLNLHSGNFAAMATGRMLLYSVLWALPLFGIAYWTVR